MKPPSPCEIFLKEKKPTKTSSTESVWRYTAIHILSHNLLIWVHVMGAAVSAKKPRPHPFPRRFHQPLHWDAEAFPSLMVNVISHACPRTVMGFSFHQTWPKHPHSRMSRKIYLTQLLHKLWPGDSNEKGKISLFLFLNQHKLTV